MAKRTSIRQSLRKEMRMKINFLTSALLSFFLLLCSVCSSSPLLIHAAIDGVPLIDGVLSTEIPVHNTEKTYTLRFTFSSWDHGNAREAVYYYVRLRFRDGSTKSITDQYHIPTSAFKNTYVDGAIAFKVPKDMWDGYVDFVYESSSGPLDNRTVYPGFRPFPTQKWQYPTPPAERAIPQVWENIKLDVVYNLSTTTDYYVQKAIRTSNVKPVIVQGQAIYSQNQQYILEFQNDGNLVLYRSADRGAIWAANHATVGNMRYPGELWFYETGELAIVRKLPDRDQKVWVSGSYVDPNSPNGNLAKWAQILVQNDGNVVMYAGYNKETTNVLPFRTQTGGGHRSPHYGFLR